MDLEQNIQDGNFDEANNQGVSLRIYPPIVRPFCRIWERSKNLFCSGVFLKGSAVVVGLWNPKKGFRFVMMAFVFLLELFFVLNSFYRALVCWRFDASLNSLNSLFCGNSSSNSSSLRPSSPMSALQGIELRRVLQLVANFSVLMSNVAFFWCMWKLGQRSVYCVTMDKAYRAAKRCNWVTLNCTMLTFGILLLIQLFWLNWSFEEKLSLAYRVGVSLSIIPMWAILTNSWVFALITNAMKDCVSSCHAEIRNATQCSTDDIIRIHKCLCQQLSSTSEALKIWFVAHWFFLAIFSVIFVAEMVSLFKYASDWFFLYEFALWTFISLYVFVYPNYCASSVTVRCNKIFVYPNGSVENAECGVRSAECGVWKVRSVESTECGKCGVWKVRSEENFNFLFQFQFSISISGEMRRNSVLTIRKNAMNHCVLHVDASTYTNT